ncbi:hypothetical protein GOODEAATRI_012258 [Goodea atripinnis]|uniref:Uncharacterized protein n=1 Tax=Goodea atripinnis TaxID=208336 RepID=A0ABV0NKJ8_9TELE
MEDVRGSVLFRNCTDLLAHDESWLISRFRLPWAIVLEFCTELASVLQNETRRNCASAVFSLSSFQPSAIHEPGHASHMGRPHPYVAQIYNVPLNCCSHLQQGADF